VTSASSKPRGTWLSAVTSINSSVFAFSDCTLYSSSRLVGGVDMEGDALDMMRASICFSVWTVMLESVEDVDVGDASRAAMFGKAQLLVALRWVVLRRGSDAKERSMVWATRDARAATVPKCTRCKQATTFATSDQIDRGCKNRLTGFWGRPDTVQRSGVVI
jgi:hypothetical protein